MSNFVEKRSIITLEVCQRTIEGILSNNNYIFARMKSPRRNTLVEMRCRT